MFRAAISRCRWACAHDGWRRGKSRLRSWSRLVRPATKRLRPGKGNNLEMDAESKRHVHLIGICGTAMASLAGMLKHLGLHVTGSDAAAYPPMSDFLESLAIPVAQPFSEANLKPAPDFVVVGNAISRGNPELEYVLDQRIPIRSLPQVLQEC